MLKTHYAPYIDGLRAIAVVSVIAYHINAAILPGGFTGVDVFFVISGYVVSASVAARAEMSLPAFLGYFYARRLFRIAPALIICLVFTTLVFALFIPAAWLSGTNQKTGLAAFFGLSNFVLARTDNDYFSPRVAFNPFTHTWSLGVEEQFYLLFPFLFIAWLSARRRLSFSLIAAGFLASLTWAYWLGLSNPDRAFYMLTSRFWELASGVLLFQFLALNGREFGAAPAFSRSANWGALLSLALLAVGLITARPSSTPFPGGILPVLGAVGILGFLQGRAKAGIVLAVLENRFLRFTGKISYSLYLWHWPVLVFFRWTVGLQTGLNCLAALLIIFILATGSYYFVETPPRRALATFRYSRLTAIAVGVVALGIGYGIANGLWALQPEISISSVMRHADEWYPDGDVTDAAFPGCKVESSKFRISGGLRLSYARAGCADAVTFPHQVFMIGDSHAAAYEVMMKDLAIHTGARTFVYGVGGCSFMSLRATSSQACEAFDEAAVADMLTKLHPGDVVFLPALRIPRIVDQFTVYGLLAAQADMVSPDSIAARQTAVVAALPVLRQLAAAKALIVFEAPTPVLPSPTFRCADWFDRHNPICAGGDSIPRTTITALRAPVLAAYADFQQAVPGVKVWDPLPVLCPGEVCSAYRNGHPLFFDGDHLSGYANTLLLPDFMKAVGAVRFMLPGQGPPAGLPVPPLQRAVPPACPHPAPSSCAPAPRSAGS